MQSVSKLILSKELKYKLLIDKEDEYLLNVKWSRSIQGYAYNFTLGLMHRVLLNAKKHDICDHINGNRLDNRKLNLRIVTYAINAQNQLKTKKPRLSKFKGVTFDKGRNKWKSGIGHKGKFINLGRFNVEVEAAAAYNEAAIKLFGQFAKLNVL